MKKTFLIFGLLYSMTTFGQTAHQLLRSGNSDYNGKHYSDAEIDYRKALEANPGSVKGIYNLGNAIYNQAGSIQDENIKKGRYDEAARQFEDAASSAASDVVKSNAYYNLGNARLMNKEYDKSIEAYKQALRLNPKDEDAKHNLSYAIKQYKQQQQQQQQDKKDENKEDNKEDKKDEQKQDEQKQNKKDEEDKKEEQQDQQKDKKQQEEQKPEAERLEKQELSKEDAKRLLKIMENEERKVQEKMRRGTGKKVKPEKEW